MTNSSIAWVVLTHESAISVTNMLNHWRDIGCQRVVVIHGGSYEEFLKIEWEECYFINSDRIRTKDHQRERQSYSDVFKLIFESLSLDGIENLYFTEYDQIPLRSRFVDEIESRALENRGGVLFSGLKRVDGTSNAIWLNHLYTGELVDEIERCSVMGNKRILSAYGFGQLWSISAFCKVAQHQSQPLVYLELWLPSIAYHLGCSVGELGLDCEYNSHLCQDFDVEKMVESKLACVIHPVKNFF